MADTGKSITFKRLLRFKLVLTVYDNAGAKLELLDTYAAEEYVVFTGHYMYSENAVGQMAALHDDSEAINWAFYNSGGSSDVA